MSELVTIGSSYSVEETVERLLAELAQRSISVFARIDHGQAARGVGLELQDETVLIFGNPQTGTPLMQEDPRVGLDLPLRILIWSDSGRTTVAYHDPEQLAQTYNLETTRQTLSRLRHLLDELAGAAAH
jgi:uncharacterized protein (DUF302 family)